MQYEFLPLTWKLVNGKLIPIPGFQVWMACPARRVVATSGCVPPTRPILR
jgi:hypothetical protein